MAHFHPITPAPLSSSLPPGYSLRYDDGQASHTKDSLPLPRTRPSAGTHSHLSSCYKYRSPSLRAPSRLPQVSHRDTGASPKVLSTMSLPFRVWLNTLSSSRPAAPADTSTVASCVRPPPSLSAASFSRGQNTIGSNLKLCASPNYCTHDACLRAALGLDHPTQLSASEPLTQEDTSLHSPALQQSSAPPEQPEPASLLPSSDDVKPIQKLARESPPLVDEPMMSQQQLPVLPPLPVKPDPPPPDAPPVTSAVPQICEEPAPEYDETFLCGTLKVIVHSCSNLPSLNVYWLSGLTDAYVRIWVNQKNGFDHEPPKMKPVFEEEFSLFLVGEIVGIAFKVKDYDPVSIHGSIGEVAISPREFMHHKIHRKKFALVNGPVPRKGEATIELSLEYFRSDMYRDVSEVPDCTFPQRTSCRLTMYQDAHVDDQQLPEIELAEGKTYRHSSAWDDMYAAMDAAKHLIFLTGWSLWTELRMCRPRQPDPELRTLGTLLKDKAAEGLKVFLMIWDDVTSMRNRIINCLVPCTRTGMMETECKATRSFFKKRDSRVVCQLASRKTHGFSRKGQAADGRPSWRSAILGRLGGDLASAGFSHHQKTLICDAPSLSGDPRRRIIAFVGGLDLTRGRFDTPEHPIFTSVEKSYLGHWGDFRNGCYLGFHARYGPRQPWHDVHAMVEGPAARDLMENFCSRWLKGRLHHRPKLVGLEALSSSLKSLHASRMLKVESLKFNPWKRCAEDILSDSEDIVQTEDRWKIQVFRSIDRQAAKFVRDLGRPISNGFSTHFRRFPKRIEADIHKAYIHAIRRANRFIYIENQYFIGSSSQWLDFDEFDYNHNYDAKHHIPYELAMRAVAKIRSRQRFCIYVCIPLAPEGGMNSAAVQAILHWQFKTFTMMYKRIGEALQKYGPVGAHPTDYLSVYCLGKRETPNPVAGEASRLQQQLCQLGRHPIYVHSKMMICDDEYIIIGSANINQRSMVGNRDTEIAVGAMEDDGGPSATHISQSKRGQVFGFRMSLWAEHLNGQCCAEFLTPESVICVRKLNQMAEANWTAYVDNERVYSALPFGHLMRYPYKVEGNGDISAIVEEFPDAPSGSKVCGTEQLGLQLLTT